MSFPLLPILPQIQYLKPEVPPTVMVDSEQTPFTVFFGLENQAEDQATDDSVQDEAVLEVPFDQLESTAQDTEDSQVFAISDAPNQHTKAPTARPPQTLVESAFFPVAAPTSPDEPAKVLAPLPSQQATPIVLTETRAMASPVAPPKQDDARQLPPRTQTPESPIQIATATPMRPDVTTLKAEPWKSHAETVPLVQKPSAQEDRIDPKPITIVADRAATVLAPQTASPAKQSSPRPNTKEQRIEVSERLGPVSTQPQPQVASAAPTQAPILAGLPLSSSAPKLGSSGPIELGIVEKFNDIPLVQGQSDVKIGSLRAAPHDAGHLLPQPQQIAKSVANQMAVAVAQNGSGTTELILSPEELGRVRMVMSSQDGGIAVLIHTERPETSDLLRRHIETLSQEFKNMGYNSTAFAFAQDQQDQSAPRSGSRAPETMLPEGEPDMQHHATVTVSEGLDLRL